MDLVKIMETFPTQEDCIAYLERLRWQGSFEFIKRFVKTEDSELYTDQYRGYNEVGKEMKHETMNRSEKWEEGAVHTNTMEGFWSFVKRAWYGSHHHYTTGYTTLYLAEACYKYNYRETNMFEKFLRELWE